MELVNARDIAKLLKISTRGVFRLADRGAMPPRLKLGASSRWRRGDIEAWIADGCPPNGNPTTIKSTRNKK